MASVRILFCLLVAFSLPLQGWASATLFCMNSPSAETAMHLQVTASASQHAMAMDVAASAPPECHRHRHHTLRRRLSREHR